MLNEIRLPVKNTGMLMKKPPTAQTRLIDDFCRYLFVLKHKKRIHIYIHTKIKS
jgi:hypothetical protein